MAISQSFVELDRAGVSCGDVQLHAAYPGGVSVRLDLLHQAPRQAFASPRRGYIERDHIADGASQLRLRLAGVRSARCRSRPAARRARPAGLAHRALLQIGASLGAKNEKAPQSTPRRARAWLASRLLDSSAGSGRSFARRHRSSYLWPNFLWHAMQPHNLGDSSLRSCCSG